MAKIYSSGNYVIVDDGVKVYEYAKGHTLYTFVDNIFYIKEITQGQFKVLASDIAKGAIKDADNVAYSLDTFTTFLRENTGFKTAAGGSAATVQNSDLSYTTTVNSGDTLNLPDITVTDSDGSTFTAPSVQDIVCTPAVAPVGATLMKTGQTTSYRTGDDGDIEAGRATDFFTLSSNNPFGNTNRFTDELGGQTYTNNIVIDWSTYNGSTVLGWDRRRNGGGSNVDVQWNAAIDAALSHSVGGFTSGWRLPNRKEVDYLTNNSISTWATYYPFNIPNENGYYWTSTTNNANTSQAFAMVRNSTAIENVSKTAAFQPRWIPCRTFTVTGTTLT